MRFINQYEKNGTKISWILMLMQMESVQLNQCGLTFFEVKLQIDLQICLISKIPITARCR